MTVRGAIASRRRRMNRVAAVTFVKRSIPPGPGRVRRLAVRQRGRSGRASNQSAGHATNDPAAQGLAARRAACAGTGTP